MDPAFCCNEREQAAMRAPGAREAPRARVGEATKLGIFPDGEPPAWRAAARREGRTRLHNAACAH